MNIRYIVELDEAERGESDAMIARTLSAGTSTIYRTRRRLVEEGLDAALSEAPRRGAERKLNGEEEALMVARCLLDTARRQCALDAGVAGR